MNTRQFWVYIMASYRRSVLYIGVTNDLYRRYREHKEGKIAGFTKKYHCHDLVYYEEYTDALEAIQREKELKGKSRQYKVELIKMKNPLMSNLAVKLGWL